MATQNTQPGTGSTLQAYEDKIAAQIHAANTRIDEFEAKAKPGGHVEITAIDGLKAARQNIERMPVDLKTTRDAQIARAKVDIDAAIVTLTYRGLQAQVHNTVGEEVTAGSERIWN